MREEDDEDSRRGGAEVTRRRRRRRRGRPGVCAAQSHGEEIVVIIYFILLVNLLSTQHPPPVSLPSPTQLASSIVDERCHRSSSSFSSSLRFVAASKSHVAPLVESFVHTMQASSDFRRRSAQGTPRSSSAATAACAHCHLPSPRPPWQ